MSTTVVAEPAAGPQETERRAARRGRPGGEGDEEAAGGHGRRLGALPAAAGRPRVRPPPPARRPVRHPHAQTARVYRLLRPSAADRRPSRRPGRRGPGGASLRVSAADIRPARRRQAPKAVHLEQIDRVVFVGGKPGNFPLTGYDLPSHWFV